MLRSLTLALVLLGLAPAASAQIALTEDAFRSQLESTTTSTTYNLVFSPGAPAIQALATLSGANKTWNFTGFTYDAPETSTVAPAGPGAPGADDPALAEATHVLRSVATDTSAYVFLRLSASAYEVLGVTAESQSGNAFDGIVYTPAQRLFALPLMNGSTWTSTSDLAFSPALDGLTIRESATNTVEGWGTLATPQGFADVLKVRTVATVTGSSAGFPAFSESRQIVTFLSGGTLSASMELDGDGVVQSASVTLFSGETAAEPDAQDGGLGLRVAGANPARRGASVAVAFALPAAGEASVEVYDVLGRRLATLADGPLPADGRAEWETGAAPAGLYLVRFRAGGRTAVRQVVLAN